MVGLVSDSERLWMNQALQLAETAAKQGEVPVGAVVVLDGQIIGEGYNQPITTSNPCAHAEIIALQEAGKTVQNYRLVDATLYVTLEPCSMCAGAMVHSRIKRLVYGATEPKAGVACSVQHFFEQGFLNHKVDVVGGVMAEESASLLQQFFKQRRLAKKNC